ncbi:MULTISPECIES: DUF7670 domain-containing protein [Marinifilum]|uniref:DUF7670 domain-containing protein n=1 Tax=Marinifilum TaxID=866673 RepID=UPI002274DFA9|nr:MULTISPECIES: hypothetical protein [Marinifilum]MCY1634686.1 hypothetical protein [Marinifilum sp. D737]
MTGSLKLLHWTPRVICILAILFVSLFALDAFNPALPIGKQILDFLMHMLPSFVLTALLIIAWKWELIGGIILGMIGIVFSPIIFMHNYNMNHSVVMSLTVIAMITFPFILVGVLFVISHFKKKK